MTKIYVEETWPGEYAMHGLSANHLVVLQKRLDGEHLRKGEATLLLQMQKAVFNPTKKEVVK